MGVCSPTLVNLLLDETINLLGCECFGSEGSPVSLFPNVPTSLDEGRGRSCFGILEEAAARHSGMPSMLAEILNPGKPVQLATFPKLLWHKHT